MGRDEYGGSNVFRYFSSSQQASVYDGTWLGRAAGASESLVVDAIKRQLGGSTSGNYDNRHTTATARDSTVWRGL